MELQNGSIGPSSRWSGPCSSTQPFWISSGGKPQGRRPISRIGSQNDDGKIPEELWTGKKPDISHLRISGCLAYRLNNRSNKRNWNPSPSGGFSSDIRRRRGNTRCMAPMATRLFELQP